MEGQARDYAYGVDRTCRNTLSTGVITQFVNGLDPDPRSRVVFTFHRPEELLRLVSEEAQLRKRLRRPPVFVTGKLWPVQVEAIQNLERSLAANRPRALIQMATGSGFFLVDRKTHGKQTLNEFQQFVSPYGKNYKFTESIRFRAQERGRGIRVRVPPVPSRAL